MSAKKEYSDSAASSLSCLFHTVQQQMWWLKIKKIRINLNTIVWIINVVTCVCCWSLLDLKRTCKKRNALSVICAYQQWWQWLGQQLWVVNVEQPPMVVHGKFFQSSKNSESNSFLQHHVIFFLFAIARPHVLHTVYQWTICEPLLYFKATKTFASTLHCCNMIWWNCLRWVVLEE